MFDTHVRSTSESHTGVACSSSNLVTLRDRNQKFWVIQKELIAYIREEEGLKVSRVVLSNNDWFDVNLLPEELAAALGLPALPPA